MEFRILGPLDVVAHGRSQPRGGSRQRALLGLLLTRANEIVSADRLVEELWRGRPPGGAANALQYHVSQLRKTLGSHDRIATREPGYGIRVAADELDLFRFEQLVEEAFGAPPAAAADLLREALALWRGPPLADLPHESFALEIMRLEELQTAALERRLQADLALGRHTAVIGELESLVRTHPLREGFSAHLMRALYAAGRQADALDVYRRTRALLVEELGVEPGIELQELERAVLRQDPALLPSAPVAPAPRRRAIVAVAGSEERLDLMLDVAAPLARRPNYELVLVRLLPEGGDVTAATALLDTRRNQLAESGVSCRVAAYTAPDPGLDVALFARAHDVDLILADAPRNLLEAGILDERLTAILDHVPCDVGLLVGDEARTHGAVVTPFGGVEHDWSAIEVAAWLAKSLGTTLRLLGTEADPARGRRDASRLLARASLVIQQVIGIATEPVLVRPGGEGVLEAARDARLLVMGLSERWRTEGLGPARRAVAAGTDAPTLFVRRGPRPGGVAPDESLTRFTWTLGVHGVEPAD